MGKRIAPSGTGRAPSDRAVAAETQLLQVTRKRSLPDMLKSATLKKGRPRPASRWSLERAELRRLLEHDAAKSPTPRTPQGGLVTFADAAQWLAPGEANAWLSVFSYDVRPPIALVLITRNSSMTTESLPDLDIECFFIAPIGAEGSEVRERSDGVMEYIVTPAAQALDLVTIRADKIAKPGQITRQVIEHVVGAKAGVVDLTGANPNVYYEMAVRHTAQLATVLIAQDGEKLPFDISQMRTIFFDHTSLKSAAECRDQITQHLEEALGGAVDSPIAASVSVQRLEQGTAQERVLAQMVDGIDEIRARMQGMEHRRDRRPLSPQVVHVLMRTIADLESNHDDPRVVGNLREIADYLSNAFEQPLPRFPRLPRRLATPVDEPEESESQPGPSADENSGDGESDAREEIAENG